MDRLGGRARRRAGGAVLLVLAALIVHNVPNAARNQRELPRDRVNEMDDWFAVSPRDLEHVASDSPRFTIYGRIAVFYFLEQRIGGTTLTIPAWWAWNRWELERVAHLHVEIAGTPLMLAEAHARGLRDSGERRPFHPYSRRNRKFTNLYLHRDPGAERYVMVQSDRYRDFFVLSEEHYARLQADVVSP